MSIPVEIAELEERIAEYGDQAFLVTVTESGTPHVVSVVVRIEADRLVMRAGNRTRANLDRSPSATLLWAPPPLGAYSLIVDGTHDADRCGDESIAVEVASAVLHRMAGTPGEGPNCVPVAPA
jgi:hypothetical protein